MRRTLWAWVGAVCALASSAPAARADGPAAGLPARLRVLVPSDEMPEMFSFEPKGQPGFERELIEGFCRIHGLSLEVIQVKDFDQIIPMLLRGEGDVITGIVDTKERRQKAPGAERLPARDAAGAPDADVQVPERGGADPDCSRAARVIVTTHAKDRGVTAERGARRV